ncbi:MAG: hypothetical protein WBA57_23810 [Elainellaceae cyanobacterium]
MYRRSLTRQINHQVPEHSSIASIARNFVALLQFIVQPEDPQSTQNPRSPEDTGSVIFSSNEFLTMHLLTDCYEGDA